MTSKRGNPPYFSCYEIRTNIPATKFDLSEQDVRELYQNGKEVGAHVDWEGGSADTQVVLYYDPRPQEALQFSLEQAHKLFKEYTSRPRLKGLHQETTFSVFIERDWSTRYATKTRFTVEGESELFLTRFVATGRSTVSSVPVSLVDSKFIAKEILPGEKRDLIRIPAYNSEDTKGFLLFYMPPISKDKVRDTYTEFGIYQEFASSLGVGKPDFVSYSVQQLADEHHLARTLEILVDIGLSPLEFEPSFGNDLDDNGTTSDPASGKVYRKFSVQHADFRVAHESSFQVNIRISARH